MLAREWLESNFRADTHPGKYIPAHETNREAVYYYYAASVAKALRAAKVKEAGGVQWAEALAAELIKRQQPDGSWVNTVTLVREDEPLVATASAVIAQRSIALQRNSAASIFSSATTISNSGVRCICRILSAISAV